MSCGRAAPVFARRPGPCRPGGTVPSRDKLTREIQGILNDVTQSPMGYMPLVIKTVTDTVVRCPDFKNISGAATVQNCADFSTTSAIITAAHLLCGELSQLGFFSLTSADRSEAWLDLVKFVEGTVYEVDELEVNIRSGQTWNESMLNTKLGLVNQIDQVAAMTMQLHQLKQLLPPYDVTPADKEVRRLAIVLSSRMVFCHYSHCVQNRIERTTPMQLHLLNPWAELLVDLLHQADPLDERIQKVRMKLQVTSVENLVMEAYPMEIGQLQVLFEKLMNYPGMEKGADPNGNEVHNDSSLCNTEPNEVIMVDTTPFAQPPHQPEPSCMRSSPIKMTEETLENKFHASGAKFTKTKPPPVRLPSPTTVTDQASPPIDGDKEEEQTEQVQQEDEDTVILAAYSVKTEPFSPPAELQSADIILTADDVIYINDSSDDDDDDGEKDDTFAGYGDLMDGMDEGTRARVESQKARLREECAAVEKHVSWEKSSPDQISQDAVKKQRMETLTKQHPVVIEPPRKSRKRQLSGPSAHPTAGSTGTVLLQIPVMASAAPQTTCSAGTVPPQIHASSSEACQPTASAGRAPPQKPITSSAARPPADSAETATQIPVTSSSYKKTQEGRPDPPAGDGPSSRSGPVPSVFVSSTFKPIVRPDNRDGSMLNEKPCSSSSAKTAALPRQDPRLAGRPVTSAKLKFSKPPQPEPDPRRQMKAKQKIAPRKVSPLNRHEARMAKPYDPYGFRIPRRKADTATTTGTTQGSSASTYSDYIRAVSERSGKKHAKPSQQKPGNHFRNNSLMSPESRLSIPRMYEAKSSFGRPQTARPAAAASSLGAMGCSPPQHVPGYLHTSPGEMSMYDRAPTATSPQSEDEQYRTDGMNNPHVKLFGGGCKGPRSLMAESDFSSLVSHMDQG